MSQKSYFTGVLIFQRVSNFRICEVLAFKEMQMTTTAGKADVWGWGGNFSFWILFYSREYEFKGSDLWLKS